MSANHLFTFFILNDFFDSALLSFTERTVLKSPNMIMNDVYPFKLYLQ